MKRAIEILREEAEALRGMAEKAAQRGEYGPAKQLRYEARRCEKAADMLAGTDGREVSADDFRGPMIGCAIGAVIIAVWLGAMIFGCYHF